MISGFRRQYHIRILNYLIGNFLWRLRLHFGWISGGGGDSHGHLSPEKSIIHIERLFQWYLRYGHGALSKGVCVEIGPGDSAGVAMLMRQQGVDQAILVDRFRSPREKNNQKKIYEMLADRYNLGYLKTGPVWDDDSINGIQWHIGLSAETFFQKAVEQDQSFDAIVSCAVMEHLYDPLGCLKNMIHCLEPGGTMVHCIDFRDHGMFEPRYHPLKFLSIPTSLYRRMTRNSGDQNRVLLHEYRKILEEAAQMGIISKDIYVWMLVGEKELDPFIRLDEMTSDRFSQAVALVDKWRHEFVEEFREVSSQDLAVAGICLVIKKEEHLY